MPIYETKKPTKDSRKYFFRCYYTDKYGAKKQYESKKYLGKRECERAERKFLEERDKYYLIENNSYDNLMFKDIYDEWWLYKRNTIKDTTLYTEHKNMDKRFLNYFKDYKLSSVNKNVICGWYNELLNVPLSNRYKNRMIGYALEFFDFANVNYDFSKKNYINVQHIKSSEIVNQRDSEWNYLTLDEFNKFIGVVKDEIYYLIFNFLYYTGLRIGEFNALRWNDIDFKSKTFRVNKTLSNKIGTGGYAILPPKTKNSVRIVDIDDYILDLLIEHKKKESKIYGFNDNMFVFGNITYIPPTTISRHLKNALKVANIPSKKIDYREGDSIITLHGFRHSHASLLINLGLDFKDVAERLGDTPEMIQKVYYHMFPQKKSNTVNALNRLNKEP